MKAADQMVAAADEKILIRKHCCERDFSTRRSLFFEVKAAGGCVAIRVVRRQLVVMTSVTSLLGMMTKERWNHKRR